MKRFYGKKREHGAITVMAAFVLMVAIGFTAIAVDLGMWRYKEAKLQNATDAAATAVAGNLGTIDTSLEEIAYDYLAKNGFDKDEYGKDSNGKNILQVKIERKGEVSLESVEDERYINTGYYKLSVWTNEGTMFGKFLDKDSLKLHAESYVKAEANYVPMPRALNYTIFAGSTKGTASSPAIKVDGRTNKVFNLVTYFTERGINIINNAVVQPLIGFFGGSPNYGDLVHINLSEIVSNGDVHSNSNIGVGVQALNVSRTKDRDFEGTNNVETYSEIQVEETDFERGFNDYGQVTFTAVKDIRFNYLNNYADGQTRVYIQNQQYLEQTQVALNIIDLISDFDSIRSKATLQSKYEEAAEVYVSKQFNLTDAQRAAIVAQKENLDYVGPGEFKLNSQGSVVYYIHANKANEFLDYAENKGVDGLITDVESSGNDKMFKGNPENISNGNLYNTSVDKAESISSTVNFTKKNSDNTVSQTAKLSTVGNSVGRNYGNLGSNPNAITLNGARFATAQTFRENSEYIEIPNMKPYFSRQINRSIRNATKSRELINTSDAGQKNIKAAVESKNTELANLTKNLSFENEVKENGVKSNKVTFENIDYKQTSNYVNKDTTILFKTYKPSSMSGVINLDENIRSYNEKIRNADNNDHIEADYNVSISRSTYKGYSLYDSNNNLKTPSQFVAEEKTMITSVKRFGNTAIQDKRNAILDSAHNGANSEKTAVSRKKTEIKNNTNFDYDYEKNGSNNNNNVKKRIEDPEFPNITKEELVVPSSAGRITVDGILADKRDYFLVTKDNSYVAPTGSPTKFYKDTVAEVKNINSNYFPIYTAPSSDHWARYNNQEGVIHLQPGTYWKKTDGTTTTAGDAGADVWWSAWYYHGNNSRTDDRSTALENATFVQGGYIYNKKKNIDIKGHSSVIVENYVECGGELQIRAGNVLYCYGNVTCNKLVMESGAKLYVGGTLTFKETSFATGTTIYAGSINVNDQGGSKDLYISSYTVCVGDFTCYDRLMVNSDNVLKVGGNLNLSGDNAYYSIINKGKVYVGGNVTGDFMFVSDGVNSDFYVCGNLTMGKHEKAWTESKDTMRNTFVLCNNTHVYVEGQIICNCSATNDDNKRVIWINSKEKYDGSINGSSNQNAVLSIYSGGTGNAALSRIDGVFNEQSNSSLYFGTGFTTSKANENFVNQATMLCFGNVSLPCGTINLSNAKVSYVDGSFTATSATLNLSGGHTLYATGDIKVANLNLNDSSKVHSNTSITITGTLNLNGAASLIEGDDGGVNYGTLGTSNGTINAPTSFTGSKLDFTGIEEYLYTPAGGTATYNSVKLDKCVVKINGNLDVKGDLELNATGSNKACILYVTGTVTVKGTIKLNYGNLYCPNDISAGAVEAHDWSLLLARNGDDVNTVWTGDVFVADLTVTKDAGIIADSSSKIYVEGEISTKNTNVSGNAQVLGYKALNITKEYSTGSTNTGQFNVQSGAEIFCGEQSSCSSSVGIYATGTLFYPNTGISECKHLDVGSTGKVVVDGSDNTQNFIVKDYALVDTNGTFCNHGYTKVESCRFTNRGMMYLLGGVDINAASTSETTQDFILADNSETYIGRTASGSELSTLNYKGYYEGKGNVYIDNNLNIAGKNTSNTVMKDHPMDEFDKKHDNKDYAKRNTCVCVTNGTTYVSGSVTTSNGNAIWTEPGCKLIMNKDFNIGSAICNYGTIHVIEGNLNLNNSTSNMYLTVGDLYNYTANIKTSEKWENNYKNDSLVNGWTEDDNSADFYVGGTSNITFIGTVKNYGSIYINSAVDIRGYDMNISDVSGDVAVVNYSGAQTHINGSVKLNSNQFYNKPNKSNRDTVFACEGNLTYGGCLYNCGKVYANGSITNDESTSQTMRTDGRYYVTEHFSVLNGFKKVNDDVKNNFANKTYGDAELFCTGNLKVGTSEVGGESGSILSRGKMFVGGSMEIDTNGPAFSITNIGDIFSNKGSHSYFRIGLWLYDNSDTFVGNECFVGAGVVTGKDSIFMCGGNYRSKRSTKIGIDMCMAYGLDLGGYMTVRDLKTSWGTDKDYNSSYFYVGGTALINTIGSKTQSTTMGTVAPENASRDMDIYSNANVYIGGWLYANSKVYMKENVAMMVAGNGTGFFDNNGNLSNLIYKLGGDLSVPEKPLTNGLSVYTYLNSNKNCKFYIYQCLDMYPLSKLVVNGGMHVNDTTKIRDMTKVFLNGNFEGDEYVEIGKSLDGDDETEAKESGFIQAGENLNDYKFSNSAYMYVGGNYRSGKGNVTSWLQETFFSTGYTKVFASATLKVKGTVTSNKYVTLRHDAVIYSGGDLTAATSIDGGNYSELYVGGDMTAGASGFTKIIDTLDILNISSRGSIDLREQCQCIVGGNVFSTKHIQIGELAQGSYTRGRGTPSVVGDVDESDEISYNDEDITERVCPKCEDPLTPEEISNDKCGKCGKVLSLICPYCGKDLSESEQANNHCDDCNKDIAANNDENGNDEGISDATTLDTSTYLNENDDDAYGANVFVQGTMIALNGHIKEFTYSSVMVGKYVFAPDYITIRSNADLWIMPEMFGNDTYRYLPYQGADAETLWGKIKEWFKKLAYEFDQKYRPKEGSIYTLGDLTLNKNASLMGTYDCYIPGKMIMRADSLAYFGHDVSCYASTALSAAGGAIGNLKNLITGSSTRQTYTGFDALGEAGKGWRYTCKNYTDPRHHGYYYNMTTRKDDPIEGTLVCDVCGEPIDLRTKKEVQVSYPAVIYAFHDINIATTVDMQMTYLVADRGNVNLTNVYTATNWNETNLKELPNAIGSYQGNINYFAMYGKLAALFYAPTNNINFDGYYSEIWGCVLGNTVEMNCYYQAFHRFNNWRTMDLQIAESGSVYIIPEKDYRMAADNVDADNYIDNNVTDPVQLFFKTCPNDACKKANSDRNGDGICDYCGYDYNANNVFGTP